MLSGPSTPVAEEPLPVYCSDFVDEASGGVLGVGAEYFSVVVWLESWLSWAVTVTADLPGPTSGSSRFCTACRTFDS